MPKVQLNKVARKYFAAYSGEWWIERYGKHAPYLYELNVAGVAALAKVVARCVARDINEARDMFNTEAAIAVAYKSA